MGYASLMPGPWGRYGGLPVRADAVAVLQRMGVRMIRQGGSFAKQANMAWKAWRGPVYLRNSSVDGNWRHGLISGWGALDLSC